MSAATADPRVLIASTNREGAPALWVCLLLSVVLHANLVLWIAAGPPRRPRKADDKLELAFAEPKKPAPRGNRPAPTREEKRFIDLPDGMKDEGEPARPTPNIGTRDLHARDRGDRAVTKDTPRVESKTKAPVYRPGPSLPEGPLAVRVPGSAIGGAATGRAADESKGAASAAPEAEKTTQPPDPKEVKVYLPSEAPGPPAKPDREAKPTPKKADVLLKARRFVPPSDPRQALPTAWLAARPQGTAYVVTFPRPGIIPNTPKAGVAEQGEAQYNVKCDKYGTYYKKLFRGIEVALKIRRALNYRRPYILNRVRVITIDFKVLRDGRFEGLTVKSDGGLPILASDVADGTRSASPAPPFPRYISERALKIRIEFYVE